MESGCLSLKLLPSNHPKRDQWLIFSLLMKVAITQYGALRISMIYEVMLLEFKMRFLSPLLK